MARLASGLILALVLIGAAEGREDKPVLVHATLRSVTDGKPLAHFPLRVVNSKLRPEGKDLEIETDAEGRLSLPLMTSTALESRRAGWSLGTVCVPDLLRRPELWAWREGPVEVRLEWTSEVPAPDWTKAKVRVTAVWNPERRPRAQTLPFVSSPRRPDAAGVLRITLPWAGRLRVQVEAFDATSVDRSFDLGSSPTAPEPFVVPLERREAIWTSGRVVDPDGNPVQGAEVWVTVPGYRTEYRKVALRLRVGPRPLFRPVENDVGSGDGLPFASRWGRSGYATTTRQGGRFALGLEEATQDVHLIVRVEGHRPTVHVMRVVTQDVRGVELRLTAPVEPTRVVIQASPNPALQPRLRVQKLSQPGAGPWWSVPLHDGRTASTAWIQEGERYRLRVEVRTPDADPVTYGADAVWSGQSVIELRRVSSR